MHALALLLACSLTANATAQTPDTAPLPEDRRNGATTIDTDSLRTWITELTSPPFGGRATGSAGFDRAAQRLAAHFGELELEPSGDAGTFLQSVPWTRTAAAPGSGLSVHFGERLLCRLEPGDGLSGTAAFAAKADGPVSVLRYTAEADSQPWRNVDLTGRIVFVVAPDGWGAPLHERDGQRRLRRLSNALRSAKAATTIFVSDTMCERMPDLEGRAAPGKKAANAAIRARGLVPNILFTSSSTIAALLRGTGHDPQASLDVRLDLDARAELELTMATAQAPAHNVVARLEGSDPELRAEHVVIGCHLDHLGRKDGVLHPGADDNASGTAALMAIARAFARNATKPRRSVVFVAFCGEEVGLIGSDYFTRNPPIPLASIVAELQMDMVGRSETNAARGETADRNRNSLHLIGTEKLSKDLHDLCLERNVRHAGFDLEWDEETIFARSDHFNFARHGVPIAFLFTGFHGDYHAPTDTVDKIEFDKLRRVALYAFDVAFELAQRDSRPMVDERRWRRLGKVRAQRRPAAPLRR